MLRFLETIKRDDSKSVVEFARKQQIESSKISSSSLIPAIIRHDRAFIEEVPCDILGSTETYIPRIVDSWLQDLLGTFGGIELCGPRWSGKSWTAQSFGESVTRVDEPGEIYIEGFPGTAARSCLHQRLVLYSPLLFACSFLNFSVARWESHVRDEVL